MRCPRSQLRWIVRTAVSVRVAAQFVPNYRALQSERPYCVLPRMNKRKEAHLPVHVGLLPYGSRCLTGRTCWLEPHKVVTRKKKKFLAICPALRNKEDLPNNSGIGDYDAWSREAPLINHDVPMVPSVGFVSGFINA